MSIRNLFDGKTPYKLFSETPEGVRDDAESFGNVNQTLIEKETFIPQIDFSDPANFVKYGSAESYYDDAITRIYEDYPYDGSSKEKKEYLNKSTYLDLWILENRYPRTNGFITLSAISDAAGLPDDNWREPTTQEYISFVGGPHTASQGMIGKPLSDTFGDSNVYDENIYNDAGFTGNGTRESNLKTNFDNGVTVEFWLNKGASTQDGKEVVFDLWNSTTGSASSYGRLTVTYFHGAGSKNFQITALSGTTGIYEEDVGDDLADKIDSFQHYSFRLYNSGADLKVDMYVNGDLNSQETYAGEALGEITGSLRANIGALTSEFVDSALDEHAGEGWGKLSGSLDEFRFWKTKRTSEEIGRYWFDQVYGGTNTDISNADLGVYFKFNEGITGDDSLDSTVLDYSGRVTNGAWTGYNTSARNTGSAMVISNAATFEFRDPIIYSEHPEVQSLITELQQSGSNYDVNNFTSLYNTFPTWIVEEDQQTGEDLKRLSQIMSSFFDTLYLQIQEINRLKDVSYISEDKKELPFADALLRNYGFVAPEIFADASLLDQIFDRSEGLLFEESLEELKNTIYKNIYNNIVSIYKSKGTANAFRNLIRCYGVDENLIKVNSYANNLTYDLKENKNYTSIKKNFINFYRPDNFYGTIYQQTSSVPISTSFISASGGTREDYTSFTLESEFILPKKRKRSDYDYFSTPFQTSSIMGFHSADPAASEDFTWPTNDYDFQVYTVIPSINGNQKSGYFFITSSHYGTELTSPLVENLYDNTKWNISLVVKPSKANADLVSGSSDTDYDVKFYAVNAYSDIIQQEIELEDTITTDGEKLLNTSKRIYAGAHRTNFTGSAIHGSDIKLSSVRYWASELDNSVIKLHAENSDSFGPEHPLRNVHNFATSIQNVEIPQLQTLALHWRFDQVTGSDAGSGVPTTPDAGFTVVDFSSGSVEAQQRYGWLGNVLGTPHSGRGDFFYPNETNVVNVEFVPAAVQQNPEVVSANNTINIYSTQDEQLFTRQTRPTTFTFVIEKSMYAAITAEILNYFATILDFNNLIGDPVNRYRQEYKSLGKLRQLFFEKVQNEPDVERYIEYYKWVDDSLGDMLMNLFPASADKQDGIRNMIESHVLERNKYWNKYPTVDLKQEDPEAGIRGVNELTYNWKDGHHPVNGNENEACFWWKERAERDEPPLATGDSGVDEGKEAILSATLSVLNRSYTTPYRYSVKKEKIVSSGLEKGNNIRENVKKSVKFGLTDGLLIKEVDVKDVKDCLDDSGLNLKKKLPFKLENELNDDPYASGKGDFLSPFTVISSSVKEGYQKNINDNFKSGFGITNIHIDSYIDNNVPAQGPFTDKFVGGNQHRHVELNDGTDNQDTRPEAWSLQFQAAPNSLKFIHQPINRPRAMLYRGLVAKSPLNIQNIKTNTDTYGVGNYSDEYEIVQTVGRTTNNSAFVKAGGFAPEAVPSPYVAGMDDYAKPQRGRSSHVIVNRFSAPGDPNTMGDSNGGPGLDVEAAEYSSYNDLNYRNFAVREPLTWLYASHVNQFGYYSDTFNKGQGPSEVNSLNYDGTGSVYQVNRNTIRQMKDSGSTTITASVYDNFFVQHPIPRTDRQYAWITASVISYDAFGYLPYDGSSSADLVVFSSASDFVSRVKVSGPGSRTPQFGRDKDRIGLTFDEFSPTTFNWLNLNSKEPLEYTNSFIGYKSSSLGVNIESYLNDTLIEGGIVDNGSSALLNSNILRRNGPYQHPSWKQTRGNQNPLVRKWNATNLTAYNLENGTFKLKDDSPVISKYKPLQTNLTFAIEGSKEENLRFTTTYGNDVTLFSNEEINNDLNIDDQNDNYRDNNSPYAKVRELYIAGSLQDENNLVQGIKFFSYGEQVYPAAINMYSKRNRERIGYKNTFWRDSRTARTKLGLEKFGGTNSQGFAVSQSAWALDTSEQFGTAISTFVAYNAASGAAGELQNDYTFAYNFVHDQTGDVSDLQPGPIYARKQTMGACLSTVDPFATYPWFGGEVIDLTPSLPLKIYLISNRFAASTIYLDTEELPVTNAGNTDWPGGRNNPGGHVSIFGGNAKFEAHEQAGYVNEDGNFVPSPSKPFYDKYDLYNQVMRIKNKDMSIIPEFRISDNVEKYLNSSDGFLVKNASSYSIFGVNENNTETVTYTTDDGSSATYDIQTSKEAPKNSEQDNFYRIYSNSDFMKNFEVISNDHDKFQNFPKQLTLKCTALKKFIAYDGFYPAERTLQIAENFTDVYKDSIFGGTAATSSMPSNLKMRPILAPLFSPGILYNTIKSGIAVDYPVYTGSFEVVNYEAFPIVAAGGLTDYYAIGTASDDLGRWHHRVQFEDIINPTNLEGITFFDMEPHPSASLIAPFNSSSISKGPNSNNKYSLSINNFLASTVDFFLEDSELTTISSLKQSNFNAVTSSVSYGLRIKMRRSTRGQKREDTLWPTPQEYFSNASAKGWNVRDPQGLPVPVAFNDEDYRMFTLNMYSRPSAFGPPMAGSGSYATASNGQSMGYSAIYSTTSNKILSVASPQYKSYDSTNGFNVSHTPPYYNGEAWVDIIYTPSNTGKPTIDDIQANSEIVCWRIDGYSPDAWPSGDAAASSYPMHSASVNDYAMQLTSSINIFNRLFSESLEDQDKNEAKWAIQTKFETPVLNFGPYGRANYSNPGTGSFQSLSIFNNVTLPQSGSTPWSGSSGKTTTPMGMWHQFGTIPDEAENQGIFLEVEDIPSSWLNTRAKKEDISGKYNNGFLGSLSSVVGFDKVTNSKKIGRLATSKTIFEAVVAIPFYFESETSVTSLKDKIDPERNYFKLSSTKGNIENELEEMRAFAKNIEDMKPEFIFGEDQTSLINTSFKIRDKYVFPPEFDYFRNQSAVPIAMYIFEFEHTFDKDDLSYIWQNIAPKFGTNKTTPEYFGDIEDDAEMVESVVSHPLFAGNTQQLIDLQGPNDEPVQWLVFKVKQRAKTSYNKILITNQGEKTPASENQFSYNWPYDYFSMIEFAKIDSKISYGSLELDEVSAGVAEQSQGLYSTVATTGLPSDFSSDLGDTSSTPSSDLKTKEGLINVEVASQALKNSKKIK